MLAYHHMDCFLPAQNIPVFLYSINAPINRDIACLCCAFRWDLDSVRIDQLQTLCFMYFCSSSCSAVCASFWPAHTQTEQRSMADRMKLWILHKSNNAAPFDKLVKLCRCVYLCFRTSPVWNSLKITLYLSESRLVSFVCVHQRKAWLDTWLAAFIPILKQTPSCYIHWRRLCVCVKQESEINKWLKHKLTG